MGVAGRLAPTLLHDVAETHPRIQPVLRRLTDELGIDRPRAVSLIRSVLIHGIEEFGETYLGGVGRRLRRIETIRGTIADAVGAVIERGMLPPELSGGGLGRLMDELSREMEALRSPKAAAQAEPPKLDAAKILHPVDSFESPRSYGGEKLAPDPRGRPLPGQHTGAPPGRLRDAMAAMEHAQPRRAALFRRVLSEEGDLLGLAVLAESEGGRERAIGQLVERMGDRLTGPEQEELRAAIGTLGEEHRTSLHGEATLGGRKRADAVERLKTKFNERRTARGEAPLAELPEALRVGGDETILGPLADDNPDQLLDLWDQYNGAKTRGDFREHLRARMVDTFRPQAGELQTAFDLGDKFHFEGEKGTGLLKDSAAYDPKSPNLRRVNPKERGTDLVAMRENGDIWIVDDKGYRGKLGADGTRAEVGLSSVSAFEDTFGQNLLDDASELRAAITRAQAEGRPLDPRVGAAAERLENAGKKVNALGPNPGRPKGKATQSDVERQLDLSHQASVKAILDRSDINIRLKVTSAMGDVRRMTDRLSGLGIEVVPPFTRKR